ncbi:MAG: PHP domain-containing protein [bacterium]|nr:PHP domain-containing protein [bacterium]
MKYIDLHTHSTASDGTYTPSEIIEIAEKSKLSAVALTDHDTLNGLDEFIEYAKSSPVAAIPGIEIAANWNYKEIHILGYWISTSNNILNNLLLEVRKNRNLRNIKIIEKLNSNGLDISINEVKEIAKGESIGRPHIASVLVSKGYYKTLKDVFSTCLARGGTGYASRILPDPRTTIDAIHQAGGIAFWAHSMHRNKSLSKYKNLKSDIIELTNMGLDGIEAYYAQYSYNQQIKLLKYAKELDLPVSGGSDFHGNNQPSIKMGIGIGNLKIPESVLDNLMTYCTAR